MACGSLVRWTAIPVGSKFVLEAKGNEDAFHAAALVSLNNAARPNLEHDEIVGGTAIIDIDATKQRWRIEPAVILTAAVNTPIKLKARVVDSDGNPVMVPDGNDGLEPAVCEWQTAKTAGSVLAIQIQLRSVTS